MVIRGVEIVEEHRARVHVPVLVGETLAALTGGEPAERISGTIVDGTIGAGGHARAILAACPRVRLFGIDQDPEALTHAREELALFAARSIVEHGRISKLDSLLARAGIDDVIGILLDLGANSLHFDRPERGFSFLSDGPLDMRMDPTRTRTAADIVNHWDEDDLADLFYYEGGETRSHRVARAIVEARRRVPFARTLALADTIERALAGEGKIHPATRCFQALRRAVNEEGDELHAGLEIAERILVNGGRLAVISFHSGEDGIVKRFLSERARMGRWQLASKKPIAASSLERRANPRARSAQLRAAMRVRVGVDVVNFPRPARDER